MGEFNVAGAELVVMHNRRELKKERAIICKQGGELIIHEKRVGWAKARGRCRAYEVQTFPDIITSSEHALNILASGIDVREFIL